MEVLRVFFIGQPLWYRKHVQCILYIHHLSRNVYQTTFYIDKPGSSDFTIGSHLLVFKHIYYCTEMVHYTTVLLKNILYYYSYIQMCLHLI